MAKPPLLRAAEMIASMAPGAHPLPEHEMAGLQVAMAQAGILHRRVRADLGSLEVAVDGPL